MPMRLVCPSCGAQYEVEDRMIPRAGRDVQCSNCGHGWFQIHPQDDLQGQETPAAEDMRDTQDVTPTAADRPAPQDGALDAPPDLQFDALRRALDTRRGAMRPPPPAGDTATGETGAPDGAPDGMADAEEDDNGPPPVQVTRPRPPQEVLDILRSEAQREQDARRAEAEAQVRVEDQPELDIGPPPRRPPLAPTGAPQVRGTDAPLAPEADRMLAAGALSGLAARRRRDLLPDIEEVSSTLEAGAPAKHPPPEAETVPGTARRTGGRSARVGFAGVLALAAIGVMAYGQADVIAERLPALAEPLDTYVDRINTLRVWLDRAARGLVTDLVQRGG